MFQRIKQLGQNLVQKHGAEVGAVAKIAAHALIPGAPLIVAAVESACDYAADKSQELNDEKITEMIEGLGGDVQHLEALMAHLGGQLDGVVGMMAQSAQFGATPEMLEAMMNSALESQFSALHDELRALTPELETVQRQQEAMLREQSLQGDMLRQVQDQLGAALSYHEPLASEGVVGAQVSVFLGARGRFESALFNGDLAGAERALEEMKAISPNGNTSRLCEMALKSTKKDFEGAERVARTLTGAGANNPRVQRARQSVTALAHGGGRSAPQARQAITGSFTPPTIEPGARIGDKGWRLDALIGRGGMGEVWRVTNLRGRAGALKLMKSSLVERADFVERFQAEIDALEQVRHPSVVQVKDWGRIEGVGWYFVMPFVEGQSLRSRLSRGGLTNRETLKLIKSLAEGLGACHAEGIIHRDVKPENILITPQGAPILIDFGIAHQEGVNSGETQMATGGYAPPEQLAGRQVDFSVDLYALGVVWVECCGGWDEVPSAWLSLIERLTHNHPSRRGDMRALISAIEAAESQEAAYREEESFRVAVTPLQHQSVARARTVQSPPQVGSLTTAEPSLRRSPPRRSSPTLPALFPEQSSSDQSNSIRPDRPLPQWVDSSVIYKAGGFMGLGGKKETFTFQAQTFDVSGVSFKMIRIPNQNYSISQTPVTQALYRAVTGESPSRFTGDNLPVEKVSWEDGVAFCNKLSEQMGLKPAYRWIGNDCELIAGASGFRLPFEAEWELAAKGGQNFKYAGSDNIHEVAWYSSNSGRKTHPVGQKKPNGYGLYDMSGNVWDWCADDYNNPGQHRPGASKRADRGGSWSNYAVNCRVSSRNRNSPVNRDNLIGLRLSRSLD